MNKFLLSYIETALWSSMDNANEQGGKPLDKNYSVNDLASETLIRMTADCEQFQAEYTKAVNALDYVSGDFEETQVAHDFWLTRNRHGAGFWDGDYPEVIGKALTELAHSFGECNLYVGDDDKLYIA